MADDIRKDFELTLPEADLIAAGMWAGKLNEIDKILDSFKEKNPRQLAELLKDDKYKDYTPLKELVAFTTITRPRRADEVAAEIRRIDDGNDEIDLSVFGSYNLDQLKAARDKNYDELNVLLGGSRKDDYIKAVKDALGKIVEYAEKPAYKDKPQYQIDAEIRKLDAETTGDFSKLIGKTPAELAALAADKTFEHSGNPKFAEVVKFATSPIVITQGEIEARVEKMKKAQRTEGESKVGEVRKAVAGAKNLGEVEEKVNNYASGLKFPLYHGVVGLGADQIIDGLLTKTDELTDAALKAKRDAQIAALKAAPAPTGVGGGMLNDIGDKASEAWGATKETAGGAWESVKEFAKEHPEATQNVGIAGAGLGLVAISEGIKKIPLIGPILAFFPKMLGWLGVLWAGVRVLASALGFKTGAEHEHGASDAAAKTPELTVGGTTKSAILGSATAANDKLAQSLTHASDLNTRAFELDKNPELKGAAKQLRAEADHINDVAGKMKKSLLDVTRKIQGEASPSEEKIRQLASVTAAINGAEKPVAAIERMKKDGVMALSTGDTLRTILETNKGVIDAAIVPYGAGRAIGKESIDAIMAQLRSRRIVEISDTDPLGLGIKVNTETALRNGLVDALRQMAPTGISVMDAPTGTPTPAIPEISIPVIATPETSTPPVEAPKSEEEKKKGAKNGVERAAEDGAEVAAVLSEFGVAQGSDYYTRSGTLSDKKRELAAAGKDNTD